MQTYSHFILTKAYDRYAKIVGSPPKLPPLRSKALLWGSIAPDIPLILLAIGFILYDMSQGNLGPPGADGTTSSATGYLFETLFFEAWWVKALHNLFHAPLLDLVYLAAGYWGWKHNKKWGGPLFWFAAACLVHTLIDIPLHHNDGPLIFFPFDWSFRFRSPISYWDPAYYGREFSLFEHVLVLLVAGWLIWDWWRRKRANRVPTQSKKG